MIDYGLIAIISKLELTWIKMDEGGLKYWI